MPYISVVVPVYNRAELFRRTIENVLAQEFTDFEVIVVDDASTDDTVEVARRYCSDPRVRVEVNLENIGLTRNWNVGIGLATGELVQVMQSDDYMDADYLGRVAELFRREPTVGFVAANCRHIDGDDAVINPGMAAPPRHYRAGDEAVLAIVRGGYPHVSSQVIRRRCFEEVGAFNEELWFGPDVEMTCRLASHYDFHHFGGVHTSFRRHGTNSGGPRVPTEGLRSDVSEDAAVESGLSDTRGLAGTGNRRPACSHR